MSHNFKVGDRVCLTTYATTQTFILGGVKGIGGTIINSPSGWAGRIRTAVPVQWDNGRVIGVHYESLIYEDLEFSYSFNTRKEARNYATKHNLTVIDLGKGIKPRWLVTVKDI